MNAAKSKVSARAAIILCRLRATYPDFRCALHHNNPLQLLIATILSAQCTDQRVNQVTPALFARYRTAANFAASPPGELEALIHSTGFFRNKARAIRFTTLDALCHALGCQPGELLEYVADGAEGGSQSEIAI